MESHARIRKTRLQSATFGNGDYFAVRETLPDISNLERIISIC